MPRKHTKEEFIEKAKEVHGDFYEYSLVSYINSKTNVTVICQDHGPFSIKPNNLLTGHGCKPCATHRRRNNTETFIHKATQIHGNTYDYSETVYVTAETPVKIKCKKHGIFLQQPRNHTRKNSLGCPKCAIQVISEKRLKTTSEFVQKSKKIHGEKYNYSETVYTGSNNFVNISCPEHGVFRQRAFSHSSGDGCRKCGDEKASKTRSNSITKNLNLFYRAHGSRYTYYPSTIKSHNEPCLIECNIHGKFFQKPGTHIKRHGCPKCATAGPSKAETSLADFCEGLGQVVRNDRTILNGKELDIYMPNHYLAIEYCGLYWHSDKFRDRNNHYDKWKACNARGIHLLTVFEDEDADKVRNAIFTAVGKKESELDTGPLIVKDASSKVATAFLDDHHLQGSCKKRLSYGAYDGESLVAVMAFGQTSCQSVHKWELRRFCTNGQNYQGIASKLWKKFLLEYTPKSVVSLSDRRYFTGDVHKKLGFVWDGEVKPDYEYAKRGKRWHKSGFRKNCIKKKLPELYDPSKTEKEMMEDAGYARIWDCGKDRWVWNNGEDYERKILDSNIVR